MVKQLIAAALFLPLFHSVSRAGTREHSLGLGVTAIRFSKPKLTELVIPLHYRLRQGRFGIEIGRDTFVDRGTAGLLLGIYRLGGTVSLHDGETIKPYALARANLVLDLPEDDIARGWNGGLHYTLALGANIAFNETIGAFAELGFFVTCV